MHADVAGYIRIVITKVIKVTFQIIDRTVDHIRIIHDRCNTEFLNEAVPSSPFSIAPIVDIQERIPSEGKIGVGFLLEVRLKDSRVESPAVFNLYLVFGKTILTILQDSAASNITANKNILKATLIMYDANLP